MGKLGKLIGTALGATAGTIIAPGVGTEIGAKLGGGVGGAFDKTDTVDAAGTPKTGDGAAQGALGVGQILSSALLNKKAIRNAPPAVDSQEADFNSVLNNLRKGYYTRGGLGEGSRQLGIMQANSAQNIVDASGGYTGGALAALVNNNAAFGSAFGNSVAAQGANENAILTAYGQSVDKMVGRRADLDMQRYGQTMYDARNRAQAGFGNLATAFADHTPGLLDGLHLMGDSNADGTMSPFSLLNSAPVETVISPNDPINAPTENLNPNSPNGILRKLKGASSPSLISPDDPSQYPTASLK